MTSALDTATENKLGNYSYTLGVGKRFSTRWFEIKYSVRETLHTQNTNRIFGQFAAVMFSHLSTKAAIAQVYAIARLCPYSLYKNL